MNRREFMGWVGVGCMASSLPVAIASCSSDPDNASNNPSDVDSTDPTNTDPSAATTDSDGFTQITTIAQLDSEGSVLDLEGAVPVIVVRDPDTNAIAAYDATCPHQQCKVDWKPDEKAMVCPCHGSKFAASDGSILAGPAAQPLPKLEFKESEGNVLVKLS
jgi:cytochrome b6-f complex iron-sulfur subunit